jgi:hypothetical protein
MELHSKLLTPKKLDYILGFIERLIYEGLDDLLLALGQKI